MILEIDDIISFSRRHENETIREIVRYDSGYLKDLFWADKRLCFSEDCLKDLCRLTYGHKDNWEKTNPTSINSIFKCLKSYKTPYLFDFNDESLVQENLHRLEN